MKGSLAHDQQDGSEAATTKYGNCVTSCINTIYLSSATAGPTGTGSGSGLVLYPFLNLFITGAL